MTDQVPGQMGLDEEYTDWRIDKVGDMADEAAIEAQEEIAGRIVAEEESRAITVLAPQQPTSTDQHVISGLGMLARMSDEEFEEKLRTLQVGRERVAKIQKTLMKEGTDYGKVKGIDRPFLHLPGAEALEKFYGYVAEQRTTRYVGDGVTAPHLAYRTDTYVHMGDLTGPVVAVVSASCNTWEDRYRYRQSKPMCPKCGKFELVRRKSPPSLEGKLNCPQWLGGCNAIFEPNDPSIPPSGKVENEDPWGLDETIIQIAQKRSYVAGIRRATGTSGLFTIDEDSPSVQQQSGDAPPPPPEEPKPVAVAGAAEVERGGKDTKPTKPQIDRLRALSKEKDLGPEKIAAVIKRVTDKEVTFRAGDDRRGMGVTLGAFITSSLTGDEMGAILTAIETGEVPPAVEAPAEMESAL